MVSGSDFPVGTTVNTYSVTDEAGNTATCSFQVTVVDDEVPVINCPDDVTITNDPGECSAVAQYSVRTSDNCAGTTEVQTAVSQSWLTVE